MNQRGWVRGWVVAWAVASTMGCGSPEPGTATMSSTMGEGSEEGSDGGSEGGSGSGSASGTAPTSLDDGSGDASGAETEVNPCAAAGGPLVEEDVMLQAADGTALAATVARPTDGGCLPGVLLVHQYTMDRHQWDSMLPTLVGEGYVVLAIDLRGHGDSDPQQGALSELLTDPDQAPQDVAAGLMWLGADAAVDPDRLGVVGTSIGANLSVVAVHQQLAAAAVPVSPRLDPVLSLAGSPGSLELGGPLFCLATENDGGGDQAMSCDAMVSMAAEGSAQQIIGGSSAHGVTLLEDFPEVVPTILGFLNQAL